MDVNRNERRYRLRAADGSTYESDIPGELGGYKPLSIYGKLDCPSANRHLTNGGYAAERVFIANEDVAIAAGFRPCAKCLGEKYKIWKAGGDVGSVAYPWRVPPSVRDAV